MPYRGINIVMLWAAAMEQGFAAPIWLTFRQALDLGAHVRKGEKSSLVVYADRIRKTDIDEESGEELEREIPFLKGYTVFNVEQIDGLPPHFHAPAAPVLDPVHKSFVGMHPVPLVHGMTIGEYARMINGEGWLAGGLKCDLTVVECEHYDHNRFYELPVKPSPNLPNASAVYLYPSLGLFEGTVVSVGRGTTKPFQCIGFPGNTVGQYHFTPQPTLGAKDPPHKGKECTGIDLSAYGVFQSRMERRIRLHWLIGFYQEAADKAHFFIPFFDTLAGGKDLRERIIKGEDEETIRASWQPGLRAFIKVRQKYLLYDDFVR